MTDHILVVDDEPDLKHFIELVFKRKIRKNEYRFSFALNGVQALEVLAENPDISLVMTDINMPEMDGITLLKKLRDLEMIIKPVIISAYGDLANIRKAMNHGAFDFLTKPINLKDLEITVTKTLDEVNLLKQALVDREQVIAIERELDIAHRLQLSMMPDLPRKFGPYLLEGQMQLSAKVGGDFWDLIQLNENEALFVLGDSAGHGLPSALVMSAIRHSLRALATQINDYHEFIEPLNNIIHREFRAQARYATMIFVHLVNGSSKVRYLRAGHELPVHRQNGGFGPEDWRGGLPLGLLPIRGEDEWVELTLQPGDDLYMYTDGIIDGLPDKMPGIRPILDSLHEQQHLIGNEKFFDFLGDTYQWRNFDDATLLALRYRP